MQFSMIDWPPYVLTAMHMLAAAGFDCWAVGGCVRDLALGKVPHDWDLTTDALPDQTAKVFSAFRQVHAGIRHGTVGVLINGKMLEITTYRIDGDYRDVRHPESVAFTRSLSEDLARRDFTVNAIALHPETGLFDPFHGMDDLQKGILRAVGEPEKRMKEDALRILRGLRFLARFGFSPDPDTDKAMRECKEELRNISAERIFTELDGMLVGKEVQEVLEKYPDILSVVIPEIAPCVGFLQHTPYHIYDVWGHIAASVEAIAPEPVLRWTMLLHDIGKPERFRLDEKGVGHFKGHALTSAGKAETILTRLRCPGAMKKKIVALIRWHDTTIPPEKPVIRRWLSELGIDTMRCLIQVRQADNLAKNRALSARRLEQTEQLSALIEEVVSENPCLSLGQLAVKGSELGLPPGPEIGNILRSLLDEVIDGTLPNEKEALIAEAERLHKKITNPYEFDRKTDV